jgi:hypothetical protein
MIGIAFLIILEIDRLLLPGNVQMLFIKYLINSLMAEKQHVEVITKMPLLWFAVLRAKSVYAIEK